MKRPAKTGPRLDAGEVIGLAVEGIGDALKIGPAVKRSIALGGGDDVVFERVWDEVSPRLRDFIAHTIREARD